MDKWPKDVDVRVLEKNQHVKPQLRCERFAAGWPAAFYMEIVKASSMAAIHDGEDSSGRAVSRMLTPFEIGQRARYIFDATMIFLQERDLIAVNPTAHELIEDAPSRAGFVSED